MKKENYKSKILKLLLTLIMIFYFTFIFIDLFNYKLYFLSTKLKFACIILCLIISLLTKEDAVDLKKVRLLQTGLFLTVISDFLLLIVDDYYEIGIIIFSMAQIIYTIRYDFKNRKKIIRYYSIICSILLLVYIIMNIYFIRIDLLVLISTFYGICLVTNVYKGIKIYAHKLYPRTNGIMIAFGMILFMLCDINVVFYNILRNINITNEFLYSLYRMAYISMWLFYLPSQVLLALSGYRFDKLY